MYLIAVPVSATNDVVSGVWPPPHAAAPPAAGSKPHTIANPHETTFSVTAAAATTG